MTHTGPVNWEKRGDKYFTTEPMTWNIGKKDSEWKMTIPANFEFENSVPRLAYFFINPDDPYFLKAACIHDYLIETGFKRVFADAIWLDVTRAENAPIWKRELAYYLMQIRSTILGV